MSSEVDSIPYLGYNQDGVFRLTEQTSSAGRCLPQLSSIRRDTFCGRNVSLSNLVRIANSSLKEIEQETSASENTLSSLSELPLLCSIQNEAKKHELFKENVNKLCEKASYIHSTYNSLYNQIASQEQLPNLVNQPCGELVPAHRNSHSIINQPGQTQTHRDSRSHIRCRPVQNKKSNTNLMLRLQQYRQDGNSRIDLQKRVSDTLRERQLKSLQMANFPQINLQSIPNYIPEVRLLRSQKQFFQMCEKREQAKHEKQRIDAEYSEYLKRFDPDSDYQQYKLELKLRCKWETMTQISLAIQGFSHIYQKVCLAYKEQLYGHQVKLIQRTWKRFCKSQNIVGAVTETRREQRIIDKKKRSIQCVTKFLKAFRKKFFIRYTICRLISCAKKIQRTWRRRHGRLLMRLRAIAIQMERAIQTQITEVTKTLDDARRSTRDRGRRINELQNELRMLNSLLPGGTNQSLCDDICSRISSEKTSQHKIRKEHYSRLLEAWESHQLTLSNCIQRNPRVRIFFFILIFLRRV